MRGVCVCAICRGDGPCGGGGAEAYLAAMKQPARTYLGLLMALAIALTAHSAAALQGRRDIAGQMVICTGSGAVTVYADSEGRPVKPQHVCPDCVLHLLDAVVPQTGLPMLERLAARRVPAPEAAASGCYARLRASARAPPAALPQA